MLDERTRHARALFGGIASAYERPAEIMSLGQYGRWRRALVRGLALSPADLVLDVATGTGLVARDMTDRYGCRVIGIDQSIEMLSNGNSSQRVGGSANSLPFADERFDAVVFSYLFRYVDDPAATLRELVRVLKPGGTLASMEFGVPQSYLPRVGWTVYTRGVMTQMSRGFGVRWHEVGGFLPKSIAEWDDAWPVSKQSSAWGAAGIDDVRVRRMLFGTAVLMKGRKRGG